MSSFQKIRYLYTEDNHNKNIPPHLQDFFESPYVDANGEALMISSSDEYCCLLEEYIGKTGDGEGFFPVEIFFADYDLSDYKKQGEDDYLADKANFSGFLIQMLHALHFQCHPMGIVSSTMKGPEISNSYPSIPRINKFLSKVYYANIDMRNDDGKDIEEDIKRGVIALKKSIESLSNSGQIIVSPEDLMKLAEKPDQHEVLTIISPFAIRRLPIRGLFIDVEDECQCKEIQEWAEKLLTEDGNGAFDLKILSTASDHAKRIWGIYEKETKLIKDRWEISAITSKRLFANLHKTAVGRSEQMKVIEIEILNHLRVDSNVSKWAKERIKAKNTLSFHTRHNSEGIDKEKLQKIGIAEDKIIDLLLKHISDWELSVSEDNKYKTYRKIWGEIDNVDDFYTKEDMCLYDNLKEKYGVDIENNKICRCDRIASISEISVIENKKKIQHLIAIAILARLTIFYSTSGININWQTIFHALFPFPSQPLEFPWHKNEGWKEGKTLRRCEIDIDKLLSGEFDKGEKRLLIGLIADYINKLPLASRDEIVQNISKTAWCLKMLGRKNISLLQRLKAGGNV